MLPTYSLMDFYDVLQAFLPELIGALFVANALFFLGQNDKMGKNHLIFASLAFLVLSFKDLLNIIFHISFFNAFQEDSVLNPNIMEGVSAALTTLSAMLLVVGAFDYSKTLAYIKLPVMATSCMILWYFLSWFTLLPYSWSSILLMIYLCVGFVILAFFFFFVQFTSNAYHLRVPAIVLIFLVAYLVLSSTGKTDCFHGVQPWLIESALYIVLVLSIYRSALRQLLKETGEMAKAVRVAKAKIPQMIQSSPYPIIISALKDDRILIANEKACALFNIDKNNLRQFKLEEYFADSNSRKELLQKLSVTPSVENFQSVLKRPETNETFWLEISACVMDYENEVVLYSAFKDITAQKKHEQVLFEKAVLDPLTGCYNRRQFQELATKEIRRAWRYDTKFCLIMMDIDHFKNVNDTHGHAFGDEVLKALARVCKQTLRDSDIFARYGGEEFIVLLSQTDLVGGAVVCERLRKKIESCIVPLPSGDDFHFTISVGVVGSEASDDLDELIKRADAALYAAKENGRNQVRVFSEKESFEELKKNVLKEDSDEEDISKKLIKQANDREKEDSKK